MQNPNNTPVSETFTNIISGKYQPVSNDFGAYFSPSGSYYEPLSQELSEFAPLHKRRGDITYADLYNKERGYWFSEIPRQVGNVISGAVLNAAGDIIDLPETIVRLAHDAITPDVGYNRWYNGSSATKEFIGSGHIFGDPLRKSPDKEFDPTDPLDYTKAIFGTTESVARFALEALLTKRAVGAVAGAFGGAATTTGSALLKSSQAINMGMMGVVQARDTQDKTFNTIQKATTLKLLEANKQNASLGLPQLSQGEIESKARDAAIKGSTTAAAIAGVTNALLEHYSLSLLYKHPGTAFSRAGDKIKDVIEPIGTSKGIREFFNPKLYEARIAALKDASILATRPNVTREVLKQSLAEGTQELSQFWAQKYGELKGGAISEKDFQQSLFSGEAFMNFAGGAIMGPQQHYLFNKAPIHKIDAKKGYSWSNLENAYNRDIRQETEAIEKMREVEIENNRVLGKLATGLIQLEETGKVDNDIVDLIMGSHAIDTSAIENEDLRKAYETLQASPEFKAQQALRREQFESISTYKNKQVYANLKDKTILAGQPAKSAPGINVGTKNEAVDKQYKLDMLKTAMFNQSMYKAVTTGYSEALEQTFRDMATLKSDTRIFSQNVATNLETERKTLAQLQQDVAQLIPNTPDYDKAKTALEDTTKRVEELQKSYDSVGGLTDAQVLGLAKDETDTEFQQQAKLFADAIKLNREAYEKYVDKYGEDPALFEAGYIDDLLKVETKLQTYKAWAAFYEKRAAEYNNPQNDTDKELFEDYTKLAKEYEEAVTLTTKTLNELQSTPKKLEYRRRGKQTIKKANQPKSGILDIFKFNKNKTSSKKKQQDQTAPTTQKDDGNKLNTTESVTNDITGERKTSPTIQINRANSLLQDDFTLDELNELVKTDPSYIDFIKTELGLEYPVIDIKTLSVAATTYLDKMFTISLPETKHSTAYKLSDFAVGERIAVEVKNKPGEYNYGEVMVNNNILRVKLLATNREMTVDINTVHKLIPSKINLNSKPVFVKQWQYTQGAFIGFVDETTNTFVIAKYEGQSGQGVKVKTYEGKYYTLKHTTLVYIPGKATSAKPAVTKVTKQAIDKTKAELAKYEKDNETAVNLFKQIELLSDELDKRVAALTGKPSVDEDDNNAISQLEVELDELKKAIAKPNLQTASLNYAILNAQLKQQETDFAEQANKEKTLKLRTAVATLIQQNFKNEIWDLSLQTSATDGLHSLVAHIMNGQTPLHVVADKLKAAGKSLTDLDFPTGKTTIFETITNITVSFTVTPAEQYIINYLLNNNDPDLVTSFAKIIEGIDAENLDIVRQGVVELNTAANKASEVISSKMENLATNVITVINNNNNKANDVAVQEAITKLTEELKTLGTLLANNQQLKFGSKEISKDSDIIGNLEAQRQEYRKIMGILRAAYVTKATEQTAIKDKIFRQHFPLISSAVIRIFYPELMAENYSPLYAHIFGTSKKVANIMQGVQELMNEDDTAVFEFVQAITNPKTNNLNEVFKGVDIAQYVAYSNRDNVVNYTLNSTSIVQENRPVHFEVVTPGDINSEIKVLMETSEGEILLGYIHTMEFMRDPQHKNYKHLTSNSADILAKVRDAIINKGVTGTTIQAIGSGFAHPVKVKSEANLSLLDTVAEISPKPTIAIQTRSGGLMCNNITLMEHLKQRYNNPHIINSDILRHTSYGLHFYCHKIRETIIDGTTITAFILLPVVNNFIEKDVALTLADIVRAYLTDNFDLDGKPSLNDSDVLSFKRNFAKQFDDNFNLEQYTTVRQFINRYITQYDDLTSIVTKTYGLTDLLKLQGKVKIDTDGTRGSRPLFSLDSKIVEYTDIQGNHYVARKAQDGNWLYYYQPAGSVTDELSKEEFARDIHDPLVAEHKKLFMAGLTAMFSAHRFKVDMNHLGSDDKFTHYTTKVNGQTIGTDKKEFNSYEQYCAQNMRLPYEIPEIYNPERGESEKVLMQDPAIILDMSFIKPKQQTGSNASETAQGFDKDLAQKIQAKLEQLYPEIKLNITNEPIWEPQSNDILSQEKVVNYNEQGEVLAPNGNISKLFKDIEQLIEEQDTTINKGRKVTLYRGGKDAGQNAHEGYGDVTAEPTGTYYSLNKNYAAQYDFNKDGVKEVEMYLGKEMSSEMYYEELDKAVTNAVNTLYNGVVPDADNHVKWREIKKEIDKHFESLGYDSIVFEEIEEVLILKKNNNKINNTKQQALQLYKQTRSKEFKEWFGNSKVVDENGEPLIVYHGTDATFDTFFEENLNYFHIEYKGGQGYGSNVMPVFLNISKPYYEDIGNLQTRDYNDLFDTLAQNNKDGYISMEKKVFVTPDNTKIKSVFNQGTFSNETGNIYNQQVRETGTDVLAQNALKENEVISQQVAENRWLITATNKTWKNIAQGRAKDLKTLQDNSQKISDLLKNIKEFGYDKSQESKPGSSILGNRYENNYLDLKDGKHRAVALGILYPNDYRTIEFTGAIDFNSNKLKNANTYFGKNSNIQLQQVTERFFTNERNTETSFQSHKTLQAFDDNETNSTYNSSLFRGQATKPVVDADGNLVLNPTYETLSKDYGISFANNIGLATHYGRRNSSTPYIIEVDKAFVDTLYPLDKEAGTGAYGKRTYGDENEERVITRHTLIIPKNHYRITGGRTYKSMPNIDLINEYIRNVNIDNARDNMVFSELQGLNYEDHNVILTELLNRFGNKDNIEYYIAKTNYDVRHKLTTATSLIKDGNTLPIVYTAETKFIDANGKLKSAPDDYKFDENKEIFVSETTTSYEALPFQIVNNRIVGQANIKAMTVLIDAINQKQDTLPHEYAHHYIAWYRNTPIVQEAVAKYGSEEALVQAIGEQVVIQEGEAFDWWNKFVTWVLNQFKALSDYKREELVQILTDAFLTKVNLNDFYINSDINQSANADLFSTTEEGAVTDMTNLGSSLNEVNKENALNINFELDFLNSIDIPDELPETPHIDYTESMRLQVDKQIYDHLLIKGLSATELDHLINYFVNKTNKQLIDNKGAVLTYQKLIEGWRKDLEARLAEERLRLADVSVDINRKDPKNPKQFLASDSTTYTKYATYFKQELIRLKSELTLVSDEAKPALLDKIDTYGKALDYYTSRARVYNSAASRIKKLEAVLSEDAKYNAWDKLSNHIISGLKAVQRIKVTERESLINVYNVKELEYLVGAEEAYYEDNFSISEIQRDHAETLTTKARNFLANIPDVDVYGRPKYGFTGWIDYVPMQTVYNTLISIFADTDIYTMDEAIARLKVQDVDTKTYAFLRAVVDRLAEADEQTQIDILNAVHKHYVMTTTVLISKNKGKETFTIYTNDDNNMSVAASIKSKWLNNFLLKAQTFTNVEGKQYLSHDWVQSLLLSFHNNFDKYGLKGDILTSAGSALEDFALSGGQNVTVDEILNRRRRYQVLREMVRAGKSIPRADDTFYTTIKNNIEAAYKLLRKDPTWKLNEKVYPEDEKSGIYADFFTTGDEVISMFYKEKNVTSVMLDDLWTWLEELGVVLTADTKNYIAKYGYKGRQGYELLNNEDVEGIIPRLIDRMTHFVNTGALVDLTEEYGFMDNTSFGDLARLDARFHDNSFGESYISNDKTIYPYSNDKYIAWRTRDILNVSEYTDSTKSTVRTSAFISEIFNSKHNYAKRNRPLSEWEGVNWFLANSSWVRSAVKWQKGTNAGPVLFSGFGDNNAGLGEVIIENRDPLFSRGRLTYPSSVRLTGKNRASAYDNASSIEQEIAVIHSIFEVRDNAKMITGSPFLYAMSDKPQRFQLENVRQIPIKLSNVDEFQIHPDTLKQAFDAVVLPEIRRMQTFLPTGITSYDRGYDLFYFIPSMNYLSGEIDGQQLSTDGKFNIELLKDFDNNKLLQQAMYVEFERVINELRIEKEQHLKSLGILEQTVADGMAFNVFRYIDKRAVEYIRAAAPTYQFEALTAEYVINDLVNFANLTQLYTGDPAQYFKKGSDTMEVITETFSNLNKRLQGDRAPFITNNFAPSDEYKLIVAKDCLGVKGHRAVIGDYMRLLYAGDKYAQLAIDAYTSEKFEATNAEQYTTLREFLLVQAKSGKIPMTLYKLVAEVIKRETTAGRYYYSQKIVEALTNYDAAHKTSYLDQWNKLKFTTRKPVYVGVKNVNSQLGSTELKIFDKIASIVLIDDITAGLSVDNLRIALEREEAKDWDRPVRLTFESGLKLGIPAVPAILFDENGLFLPHNEINFGTEVQQVTYQKQAVTYEQKSILEQFGVSREANDGKYVKDIEMAKRATKVIAIQNYSGQNPIIDALDDAFANRINKENYLPEDVVMIKGLSTVIKDDITLISKEAVLEAFTEYKFLIDKAIQSGVTTFLAGTTAYDKNVDNLVYDYLVNEKKFFPKQIVVTAQANTPQTDQIYYEFTRIAKVAHNPYGLTKANLETIFNHIPQHEIAKKTLADNDFKVDSNPEQHVLSEALRDQGIDHQFDGIAKGFITGIMVPQYMLTDASGPKHSIGDLVLIPNSKSKDNDSYALVRVTNIHNKAYSYNDVKADVGFITGLSAGEYNSKYAPNKSGYNSRLVEFEFIDTVDKTISLNNIKLENEAKAKVKTKPVYDHTAAKHSYHILSRKGFGMQLDEAFHDNDVELFASQVYKSKLCDMLDITGFKVKSTGDKEYTGAELAEYEDKLYKQLFNLSLTELLDDLELDSDTGLINPERLSEILQDLIATTPGFTLFDFLNVLPNSTTNEVELDLSFSPNSLRLQQMLCSIVDTRIRKQQLHSQHYTQITGQGFETEKRLDNINELAEHVANLGNKLTRTPHYNGRFEIQGLIDETGTLITNQDQMAAAKLRPTTCAIPNDFYINNRPVNWDKYKTSDGIIDFDKVDESIFDFFSNRTPYPGPNGGSWTRVTAILPSSFRNCYITAPELMIQNGSDNDNDKQYFYMPDTLEHRGGKLTRIRELGDDITVLNRYDEYINYYLRKELGRKAKDVKSKSYEKLRNEVATKLKAILKLKKIEIKQEKHDAEAEITAEVLDQLHAIYALIEQLPFSYESLFNNHVANKGKLYEISKNKAAFQAMYTDITNVLKYHKAQVAAGYETTSVQLTASNGIDIFNVDNAYVVDILSQMKDRVEALQTDFDKQEEIKAITDEMRNAAMQEFQEYADKLYSDIKLTFLSDIATRLNLVKYKDFEAWTLEQQTTPYRRTAAIHTKLLEVLEATVKNPTSEAQRRVASPLDYGFLDSVKKLPNGDKVKDGEAFYVAQAERDLSDISTKAWSPITSKYQWNLYNTIAASTIVRGEKSILKVFMSEVQRALRLRLVEKVKDTDGTKWKDVSVRFGDINSNTFADVKDAFGGFKSLGASAYQSASFDEAKMLLLSKVYCNQYTADLERYMLLSGFAHLTPRCTAQPLYKEYVQLIRDANNPFEQFQDVETKSSSAVELLQAKYKLQTISSLIEAYPKLDQYLRLSDQDSTESLGLFANIDEIGADELRWLITFKDFKVITTKTDLILQGIDSTGKAVTKVATDFQQRVYNEYVENRDNGLNKGLMLELNDNSDDTTMYRHLYIAIQFGLLNKFKQLERYGKYVKKIMQFTKVHSTGIGNTFRFSKELETQFYEMFASDEQLKIAELDKLFGNITVIKNNVTANEAETFGTLYENAQVFEATERDNIDAAETYEIKTLNGTTLLFKPKTVTGFVYSHALRANNTLWKHFSAISNETLNNYIGEIIRIQEKANLNDSLKARLKASKRAEDAMKSWLFATQETQLYKDFEKNYTDLTKLRHLLLTNVGGNTPMADIISQVQTTKFGIENKFLNQIGYGTPVGIEGTQHLAKTFYVNATRKGALETKLTTVGFASLFSTEAAKHTVGWLVEDLDSEGVAIKRVFHLGEQNMTEHYSADRRIRPYKATELAIDMIVYQYLTGAYQGTRQIARYVPPAVLDVLGVNNYIKVLKDAKSQKFTPVHSKDRVYYDLPQPVLQYFQHHLNEVPVEVDSSIFSIYNDDGTMLKVLDEKKDALSYTLSVPSRQEDQNKPLQLYSQVYRELITVTQTGAPDKLFQLVNLKHGIYRQLSVLGFGSVTEYNKNGEATSILSGEDRKYITWNDAVEAIENDASLNINSVNKFSTRQADYTANGIKLVTLPKDYGYQPDGALPELIKELLESNAVSAENKELLETFLNNIANKNYGFDNIRFWYETNQTDVKTGKLQPFGSLSPGNTIHDMQLTLNNSAFINTNSGHPNDFLASVINHELIHAGTLRIAAKYAAGDRTKYTPRQLAVLDSIRDYLIVYFKEKKDLVDLAIQLNKDNNTHIPTKFQDQQELIAIFRSIFKKPLFENNKLNPNVLSTIVDDAGNQADLSGLNFFDNFDFLEAMAYLGSGVMRTDAQNTIIREADMPTSILARIQSLIAKLVDLFKTSIFKRAGDKEYTFNFEGYVRSLQELMSTKKLNQAEFKKYYLSLYSAAVSNMANVSDPSGVQRITDMVIAQRKSATEYAEFDKVRAALGEKAVREVFTRVDNNFNLRLTHLNASITGNNNKLSMTTDENERLDLIKNNVMLIKERTRLTKERKEFEKQFTLHLLEEIATKDVEILKKRLADIDSISDGELVYLLQITDIWTDRNKLLGQNTSAISTQAFLTGYVYEHNMYDASGKLLYAKGEPQHDEHGNVLFRGYDYYLGETAALQDKIIQEMVRRLATSINIETGYDVYNVDTVTHDALFGDKDIHWLTSMFVNIGEHTNLLSQAMMKKTRTVSHQARDKALEIVTEADSLIEAARLEGLTLNKSLPQIYDMFRGKFSATNFEDTGNMITPVYEEFFNTFNQLHKASWKGEKRQRDYHRLQFKQWARDNALVINPYVLLGKTLDLKGIDDEPLMHNGAAVHDELNKEAETLTTDSVINKLREVFGQEELDEIIATADRLLSEFETYYEANRLILQDEVRIGSKTEIDAAWELTKIVYSSCPSVGELLNPLFATTMGQDDRTIIRRFNYNVVLPSKADYINKDYFDMKQTPAIYDLYKYMRQTFQKLETYAGHNTRQQMFQNTVPYFSKSMFQEITEKGMNSALRVAFDKIHQSATIHVDEDAFMREGSERFLNANFMQKNNEYIYKYYNLLLHDFRNKKAMEGTYYLNDTDVPIEDRNALLALAKGTVAAYKNWDLGMILKLVAVQAETYRYKATIQDELKFGDIVLDKAVEPTLNLKGEARDPSSKTKERSYVNRKAAYNQFLNNFFGIKRKSTLVTKKKTYYTDLEKEFKAKIDETLESAEALKQVGEADERKALMGANYIANELTEAAEFTLKDIGAHLSLEESVRTGIKAVQWQLMAYNTTSPISNVVAGMISNFIFAGNERFYNVKDLRAAYSLLGLNAIRSLSNDVLAKNSIKAKNLVKKFDFTQTIMDDLYRGTDKVSAPKYLKFLVPFEGMRATEFLNQATFLVAMMLGKKLQKLDGTEGNLWEAFNVDGTWNEKDYGKFEDWDTEYRTSGEKTVQFSKLNEFRNRAEQLRNKIHGDYESLTRTAGRDNAFALAFLMLKQWVVAAVKDRAGAVRPDITLGLEDDGNVVMIGGRWRTPFLDLWNSDKKAGIISAFLKDIARRALVGKLLFTKQTYEELDLTPNSIANYKAFASEIVTGLTLLGAVVLMSAMHGRRKDEDDWKYNFTINMLNRAITDITMYVSVEDTQTMMQNITPLLGSVTNLLELLGTPIEGVITGYTTETGVYAGWNKWVKRGLTNLPIGREIPKLIGIGTMPTKKMAAQKLGYWLDELDDNPGNNNPDLE